MGNQKYGGNFIVQRQWPNEPSGYKRIVIAWQTDGQCSTNCAIKLNMPVVQSGRFSLTKDYISNGAIEDNLTRHAQLCKGRQSN